MPVTSTSKAESPTSTLSAVLAVDDGRKGQDLAFRIPQQGQQRLIGQNGAVLDALGMDRQNILEGQFSENQGRESGFGGFHQSIGHGKLNPGKTIHSRGHGFSFMTIQIGQLLLHLNELRQAFLGDGVSRGRTGRDVRSNPFEALGHLEASFGRALVCRNG